MKLTSSILASLLFTISTRAEEPFADLSFADALAQAGRAHKILMVEDPGTPFGSCAERDLVNQNTWEDPAVRAWLVENAIALQVDLDEEQDLAEQRVMPRPTLVFFEPSGREIDRIVGLVAPEVFLAAAKHIATGDELPQWLREELVRKLDDPWSRAAHARSCKRRGLHELALEHFLWCWDEGATHVPCFNKGSLTWEIALFGAKHPPALDALRTRRDALEARLSATLTEVELARTLAGELFWLNMVLDEEHATLKVYDALGATAGNESGGNSAVREELFPVVARLLTEARRYDDVLEGMGDNPERFALQEFDRLRNIEASEPRAISVEVLASGYAALLGLGQVERAGTLGRSIAAFEPTYETYLTLVEKAQAHGGQASVAIVDALIADAKRSLGPSDLAALQRAGRRRH